jgi:flavodoxin
VRWYSSDKAVATVRKGVVKAKGKGTAIITAKSGRKRARVKVKVVPKTVKTTKITLSPSKTIRLKVGGKKTVKATVEPEDSTQPVKWSSSNEKVAKVNSKGEVTAKGKGTAKITAKSGAKSASVKVKVSEVAQEKALVAYFSCTGTTEGVARKLANVTGADLYQIVPAEPYTAEDLDYGDRSNRATYEQDHPDTRPKIGGKSLSLKGYTRLYLGYPIWWGMEPRILCTFVESHDFTGVTVIPFCTSGSSDIGNSGSDLAKLAGTGKWLDGARHSGDISESALRKWVESLK